MFKIIRYQLPMDTDSFAEFEIVCEAPNRAAAWRWVSMLRCADPGSEYSVIEGECELPAVWRN